MGRGAKWLPAALIALTFLAVALVWGMTGPTAVVLALCFLAAVLSASQRC